MLVVITVKLTSLHRPTQMSEIQINRGIYSKCQCLLENNARETTVYSKDIASSPQVAVHYIVCHTWRMACHRHLRLVVPYYAYF